MIEALSHPDIQAFIQENLNKDLAEIALKYREILGIPIQSIIPQIQGRQRSKIKLPRWYSTPGVIFPPSLSLEQSSSETTSIYKSQLLSGESVLDLTGGFGVDSIAFAKNFDRVFYVERNPELVEIVQHNAKIFGLENLCLTNAKAEDYLQETDKVDCIYIDPARRDKHNQKVFKFEDCEPNIPALLNTLLLKANKILIKASPLLDIKAGLAELMYVSEVHVISVDHECKEVLFLLSTEGKSSPNVTAVNITNKGEQKFHFILEEESALQNEYNMPSKYLYEPNPSILKAGAFNSVGVRFGLFKLHKNSHLYTNDNLVEEFPGRKFEILSATKYDRKEVARVIETSQANITVRNFYDSSDQVRKKLGLKEGGETYLFATTDLHNKPIILITKKAV